MIEIIQRGKDKKHIVTCDNCDTDFSYTQDEVETKAKIVAKLFTRYRKYCSLSLLL